MMVADPRQFLNPLRDRLAGVDVGAERVFDGHSHPSEADGGDLRDFLLLGA